MLNYTWTFDTKKFQSISTAIIILHLSEQRNESVIVTRYDFTICKCRCISCYVSVKYSEILTIHPRLKREYPQGWVARIVDDGDWLGWRRLAAFEKSLMNLPVVATLLGISRYACAAGKLARRWFDIRLKEKKGWRERSRSRKEQWKKRDWKLQPRRDLADE